MGGGAVKKNVEDPADLPTIPHALIVFVSLVGLASKEPAGIYTGASPGIATTPPKFESCARKWKSGTKDRTL